MPDTAIPVSKPNLTDPLVTEPAQANPPAPSSSLGPLEHLVGTWTNQNLPGTQKGGTDSPYSYNLMVLPQNASSSPTGYILKNFTYYEEITFSAIHGTAPNRGGLGTQVANTLFYEQRVYFADGPAKDTLVHAENGSWLFLSDQKQLLGPYGDGQGPTTGNQTIPGSEPPTQKYDIVKQMSVPHGNSILAAGASATRTGAPSIPAPAQILPSGVNTDQYKVEGVGNPLPALNQNPNQPLVDALNQGASKVSNYIVLAVNSDNGMHPVTNIGFEQQHAKVTRYSTALWLEALDGSPDFTQLQYTQSILMAIPIPGKPDPIIFPHITCNTLTKLS